MNAEMITEILKSYVTEMEGYCYFGSNPGIPEDDIEEIVEKISALHTQSLYNTDLYITRMGRITEE